MNGIDQERSKRNSTDATQDATIKKSWSDIWPVQPAADLFPMMSQDDLIELGNDIKANGLRNAIVTWSENKGSKEFLLDGRNRLAAMEAVGIPICSDTVGGHIMLYGSNLTADPSDIADPYEYVISANLLRRHLTAEQRRELIAKLLKAKPETSNRQIARQVKVDDKTVAKVRTALETTADIPQLEKTTGKDGKKRPARKPARAGNTQKSTTQTPVIALSSLSWSVASPELRTKFVSSVGIKHLIDAAPPQKSHHIGPIDRCTMHVRATVLEIVSKMQPSEWPELFVALRDELDDCKKILERNDRSELPLVTSDDDAAKSSSERTETGTPQGSDKVYPSPSPQTGAASSACAGGEPSINSVTVEIPDGLSIPNFLLRGHPECFVKGPAK